MIVELSHEEAALVAVALDVAAARAGPDAAAKYREMIRRLAARLGDWTPAPDPDTPPSIGGCR